MSQLTSLIQAVSNLTNRFDQFMTNAKKVNELPAQTVLNPDSLIHVMIDGVSQHLSVKQILDGASTSDLISFSFKSRLNYIDSNTFTLPEGVKVLDARFNGSGSNIEWSQTDDKLTYEGGLMAVGDYLIVIGLYSNVAVGTIPNINMVALSGSTSSVTIQSPNAVNPQDLVPLSQVQSLISAFPVVDTNISNTDLTFDSNRTHNLNAKKLKFTNGDFEVPALTLDVTSTATSVINKIWYDGAKAWLTNSLGINKDISGDLSTEQIEVTGAVTALESWKGKLILVTGATTINIPSTLSQNWACEIRTFVAVLDFTITAPYVWGETTPPQLGQKMLMHLMRRGATNNFYLSY